MVLGERRRLFSRSLDRYLHHLSFAGRDRLGSTTPGASGALQPLSSRVVRQHFSMQLIEGVIQDIFSLKLDNKSLGK